MIYYRKNQLRCPTIYCVLDTSYKIQIAYFLNLELFLMQGLRKLIWFSFPKINLFI